MKLKKMTFNTDQFEEDQMREINSSLTKYIMTLQGSRAHALIFFPSLLNNKILIFDLVISYMMVSIVLNITQIDKN